MRQIEISTEVYAAIWARRQPGQENEDDILRSYFVRAESLTATGSQDDTVGFSETRSGIFLEAGTRLFREYKNKTYWAKAIGGFLVREDNGEKFKSLNSLNRSIVIGQESVWKGNWQYLDAAGLPKSTGSLRQRK